MPQETHRVRQRTPTGSTDGQRTPTGSTDGQRGPQTVNGRRQGPQTASMIHRQPPRRWLKTCGQETATRSTARRLRGPWRQAELANNPQQIQQALDNHQHTPNNLNNPQLTLNTPNWYFLASRKLNKPASDSTNHQKANNPTQTAMWINSNNYDADSKKTATYISRECSLTPVILNTNTNIRCEINVGNHIRLELHSNNIVLPWAQQHRCFN